MIRKKITQIFIASLLLLSCTQRNKDKQTNFDLPKQVENEILINKENVVFLNLFPGMSDLAFEYLIDAEVKSNSKLTKDENGFNNFYEFKIKNNPYKFKVAYDEWSVYLSYDEISDKETKQEYLSFYKKYSDILNFLLQVYGEKYKVEEIDFIKFKKYFEPDYYFREPNSVNFNVEGLKSISTKLPQRIDKLFHPSSKDDYFLFSNTEGKVVLLKSTYEYIEDYQNDYNNSEKLKFTIFYFAEKSLLDMKNHLNAIEDSKKRDYYELKRKDSLLNKNEVGNVISDL